MSGESELEHSAAVRHAESLLFRAARTHRSWFARPVTDEQLRELHELLKWAPTSINCQPLRVLFLRSRSAKERLREALAPGNVDKTMAAPVTAILGVDLEFVSTLPKLVPHTDARATFANNLELIESTAWRNGSIQGGYFILAARLLGLDVGPMSGFDNAKVDAEFFAGSSVKSNFLCNLGYGMPDSLMPRLPRLEFDEACRLL